MGSYYEERLSGERLRRCYELAPPRIARYLEAETAFVIEHLRGAGMVLELGCGYGRALREVARAVTRIIGADISGSSLQLARAFMRPRRNCALVRMDASRLGFSDGGFDAVFCIQNGISAFGVNPRELLREAARVTKDRGKILFSSYSPKIWEARLAWFRLQANAGLLGEIDVAHTGEGTIVCKDGFRATTVDAGEFERLFLEVGLSPEIKEVDASSLFCIAVK